MIKKLEELKDILMSAKKDNIISPNEIDNLQEWVDCNAVEVTSELYTSIICPLQQIIEDGEMTNKEFEDIMAVLKGMEI